MVALDDLRYDSWMLLANHVISIRRFKAVESLCVFSPQSIWVVGFVFDPESGAGYKYDRFCIP